MAFTDERILTLQTPVGACRLVWSDAGLARVRLIAPEQAAEADEPACHAPDGLKAVAAMLENYFAGAPVDFSAVALDWREVSASDADIYAALRKVGHGRTTTYGALAVAAGRPGAARAVGSAMGRNPCRSWSPAIACWPPRIVLVAFPRRGASRRSGACWPWRASTSTPACRSYRAFWTTVDASAGGPARRPVGCAGLT
jgi:methylated-DNA-[protein]-cysteine S-methyltransferase